MDRQMLMNYLSDLAHEGDSSAMFELGMMFENIFGDTHDFKQAFELFSRAADLGNSDAICRMGQYYEQGRGGVVKENMQEAVRLYTLAADSGNANAMCILGEMYQFADIHCKDALEKDSEKAFKYFQNASKKGHPRATMCLAEFYKSGEYVKKDTDQAINLLRSIAEGNYRLSKIAARQLGEIYHNIGETEESRKWFGMAAELGDEKAKDILRK